MKTYFQYIRDRLLAGVVDPPKKVDLDYLFRSQSEVVQFEKLRRARMALGWFRYGHNFVQPCGEQPGEYKPIDSAILRLKRYLVTGNQEYLVDAANLCAIEFHTPSHPSAHMTPIDDGDHHVEKAT